MVSGVDINKLKRQISGCRICVETPIGAPLPHEPRPVCVISPTAKIRIIGQAPGTRVHASGKPFTDPSGDRLRAWMKVDEAVFYDASRIAITPMGFCFPGLDAKGGDLPPRKECAIRWQDEVSAALPKVKLVLLIGQYAQAKYLTNEKGRKRFKSLTQAVESWEEVSIENGENVRCFPLPHPSWRNNTWIKKHPWFESELLPELRNAIADNL